MRLGDLDALKNTLFKTEGITWDSWKTVEKVIDNAQTVSDRYEEGYAQGYIDGSTGADWKCGAE